MNRAITIRYISVLLVLLSAIVAIADCYINSAVSMSIENTRKKNIVKNKKDTQYRKFANENEKYLYGNYLVALRKCKRTINYSKLFNNISEITKDAMDTTETTETTETREARETTETRDIKGIADDIYINIKNNTIINNDQYIAKSISLANIKIDVSSVKYIQISTKNDTITIELDKNNDNDNHISKNTDNGFINYDLGKIDSLISAISILMNLLNIH
jgi:hypothetical protein